MKSQLKTSSGNLTKTSTMDFELLCMLCTSQVTSKPFGTYNSICVEIINLCTACRRTFVVLVTPAKHASSAGSKSHTFPQLIRLLLLLSVDDLMMCCQLLCRVLHCENLESVRGTIVRRNSDEKKKKACVGPKRMPHTEGQ